MDDGRQSDAIDRLPLFDDLTDLFILSSGQVGIESKPTVDSFLHRCIGLELPKDSSGFPQPTPGKRNTMPSGIIRQDPLAPK